MSVAFNYTGSSELTSVTWRAQVGSGWVDYVDVVDLPAGASVQRTMRRNVAFPVSSVAESTVGYMSTWLGSCSPIAATAKDGSAWHAASFTAETELIPKSIPDNGVPVPATFENALHDPIGIFGCVVNISPGHAHGLFAGPGRGALEVRFKNLSPAVIDQVTFRAAYESGGFDFVFGRSFAPNVFISSDTHVAGHVLTRLMRPLPLSEAADSYQSLNEPDACTAVSVKYHDGTAWQNPAFSPNEF